MVRMALKLWKLTLEPYQSFSEDDAPGYAPAHREILYGPLNGVLRLDIFRTFTAISVHLADFH